MDDHQVVLARELDDALVDLGGAHAAHRVGGKRHDHGLGGIGDLGVDAVDVGQEVVLRGQRVVGAPGARKQRGVLEHGVARVGHEHGVARVDQRADGPQHALLGAATAHDLVAADAVDSVAVGVVGANRVEKLVLVVEGVLPVVGVGGGLLQGPHQVRRGLEVGRADRQVVDGAAGGLELAALLVEGREDLGAKQVKTLGKLHVSSPYLSIA